MNGRKSELSALRDEIDGIDESLHDLLMGRADLVERIAGAKRKVDGSVYRPAREAAVLRGLLARHRGAFPPAAIVAIWRQIMSASIAMQTELRVVAANEVEILARDHFGAAIGVEPMATAAAIDLLSEGRADLAVLPLSRGEAGRWIGAFVTTQEDGPRIAARLPATGNRGGDEALVVGRRSALCETAEASAIVLDLSREVSEEAIGAAVIDEGLPPAEVFNAPRAGGGTVSLLLFDERVEFDGEALSAFLLTEALPILQGYPAGGFPKPIPLDMETT